MKSQLSCERIKIRAPALVELFRHERRVKRVLGFDERVATPGIESDRALIDVGLHVCAAVGARETLGAFEKSTPVAPPLEVGANRDATKGRHASAHIDANHADGHIVDPEDQRMVARRCQG